MLWNMINSCFNTQNTRKSVKLPLLFTLLEVSFLFTFFICQYSSYIIIFELQRPRANQGISNLDNCFHLLYSKIVFLSVFEQDCMRRVSVN